MARAVKKIKPASGIPAWGREVLGDIGLTWADVIALGAVLCIILGPAIYIGYSFGLASAMKDQAPTEAELRQRIWFHYDSAKHLEGISEYWQCHDFDLDTCAVELRKTRSDTKWGNVECDHRTVEGICDKHIISEMSTLWWDAGAYISIMPGITTLHSDAYVASPHTYFVYVPTDAGYPGYYIREDPSNAP